MGFLDKAKKLAEQAKEKAEELAGDARGRIDAAQANRTDGSIPPPPPPGSMPPPPPPPPMAGTSRPPAAPKAPAVYGPDGRDTRWGTAYVPGMLGRPGWRERGLVDPAAILPIKDRDAAGVARATKSVVLQEPFGMGRRWTAGGASVGLFYALHDDQLAWTAPGGASPVPGVAGATQAALADGRTLVFLAGPQPVVFESSGLDDARRGALIQAVFQALASN